MAARIVGAALGVWLLAAPYLLDYDGAARISHLVVGPIAASVSVIAMSDVMRELRWVNFALGAWLVLSVLFIEHSDAALFAGVATGMALTAVSIVRGPVNQRLGGGWRAVVRLPEDPYHPGENPHHLDAESTEGGTDEHNP